MQTRAIKNFEKKYKQLYVINLLDSQFNFNITRCFLKDWLFWK